MDNLLIVVDMQNDFIDGSLGTAEARKIVPNVVRKIEGHNGGILATQDTHFPSTYGASLEGQRLPIAHCEYYEHGWKLNEDVAAALSADDISAHCFVKLTFGSEELAEFVKCLAPSSIEIVGLCTDICVLANAVLIRTALPDTPITVDASCCAGVTPERHKTALDAMKCLNIDVISEE